MKMLKKFWFMPVGVVVLFGFLYSIGWFDKASGPEQVFCTQEAKLCPDGSYVGRTGPKCEFTACPSASPKPRAVTLAYYDAGRDRDAAGNVMCSAQGIVEAQRTVPFSNTPIQDTIRLLLASPPTVSERNQGLVSEFPLEGVQLTGASVTNGVLTLTFADPDHRTGGGSCFVSILRAQVEVTAKQFPEVLEVRLMPEDLFQP